MPSSGDDTAHTVRAALLVSRQPLRPCRTTPWVQKVIAAVTWLRSQNFTLISTVGRPTWDLITAAGSLEGVRQDIIISGITADREQFIRAQFDLATDMAAFEPLNLETAPAGEATDHFMDQAILSAADLLIPISVRPGGFMARALEKAEALNQPVLWNFFAGAPAKSKPLAYRLTDLPLNPALSRLSDQYIVHWTRATSDRWPDERKIDFYRALLTSDRYPRTALDTFGHILDSGTIVASPRHMPESIPVVCFSSLSPVDVIPLIRWRARYAQMSFEPYGIGIRLSAAIRLRICPVTYLELSHRTELTETPVWLRQTIGQKTDWRQEQEYRHLGDFDLHTVDPANMILFCWTEPEAACLRRKSDLKVLPILDH